MTCSIVWWQRARVLALGLLCSGLALVTGCGDDEATLELTLTAPAAGATLTMAHDDKDPDRPGLQFDIAGASKGLRQGTTVDLYVDHDREALSAKVEEDGGLHVPGITLPPGKHRIYLQTSTGSASSDQKQAFTVRTLVIVAPEDGDIVTMGNDEDADTPGVQVGVSVDGYALAADATVNLILDGDGAGTQPLDIMGEAVGEAVFKHVTLSTGKHTLVASSGEGGAALKSEETKIEVQEECAAVSFISPIAPKSGKMLTLGGDDCPGETIKPFTTRVAIATDAGDGRPAQLFVNDHLVASTLISGASATFDDVALTNKHDAANTIAVTVENTDGVTCRKTFPADVFVDCAGASCRFASPTPAAYVDDKGDLTLFLNHALLSDGNAGFDIAVESDKDVAGQKIQLVIDGNDRNALDETAVVSGDASSALFPAVTLPEGKHTVEALCTDTHGNVTSSSEFSWVVDVTACTIDITDPTKNTMFVPADDDDPAHDGVQVLVSSDIKGDDCSDQRAAVCTPSTGIEGVKSHSYDGKSPLVSTITLQDKSSQTLCVEVADRAGNIGRDDVAVKFRNDAPKLKVESPSDGDKINAAGGSGFVQDADPSSATNCDAEFSVACSELGTPVQLFHADEAGAPSGDAIGSADCKKPKAGDADLPEGFGGRAKLTAPIDAGDVTLIATQTVSGMATGKLTGVSSTLTLHADCKPPQASFSNDPCASADGNQLSLAQAASRDVHVADASDDLVSATLSFVNDDATIGMPDADSLTSGVASFNNLDLGGAGDGSSDVTITVTLSDDFKNTTELTCTATIVNDMPTFESFTSPEDDDDFGVGALAGCDTGTPGVFGVHVVAKADQQADRALSVFVNGDAIAVDDQLGADGAIDVCVPVPDDTENSPAGSSTLSVRIDSTAGGGFVKRDRTISVHQLALTNVMSDDVYVAADNCAGSGFGYQVMVGVDPSLDGSAYTLGNGTADVTGTVSGATISACLPLAEGPNTITLSIDDTDISYQADVTVATIPPTAIVIGDQPAPDPVDPDYRKGALAAWTQPTPAYAGQFLAYHMRCQSTALAMGGDGAAWWTAAATDVAIPNDLTPSKSNPSMHVPGRPEETKHCAVRVEDVGHNLGAIQQSTNMTLKLRQVVLSTGATAVRVGYSVAALGDVDGDGINDLLVGGVGRAELIFGTDKGPAAATKVVFNGGASIGFAVSGIGDVNEDGLNDFAIGNPSASTFAGRVSVFLGRAKADWPVGDQDINTACNADLCLGGSGSNYLGTTLVPAGDFDGDDKPDLAIGSAYSPNVLGSVFPGQLLVVLGGCARTGMCDHAPPSGSFFHYSASVPSGDWVSAPPGTPPARLSGFQLDGSGPLADSRFGILIAGLGAFDANAGDDLAVAANKVSQVHYLSGRGHTPGAGFDALSVSDLGLPGQPAGTPIVTNIAGAALAAVGDFYGTANPGVTDLAIGLPVSESMYLIPGDGATAFGSSVQITRDPSRPGTSVAAGFDPIAGLELAGDIDGDHRPELCVGTRTSSPRDIMLFYAALFAASVSSGVAQGSPWISVPITAAATGAELNAQYVGDFNGDGSMDIAVGDPSVNTNQGQLFLLY